MITSYLKYFLFLIALIFIQNKLIWLISISDFEIAPDLVVIAVIFFGIKRGNIEGALAGFVSGLIIDILSGSFHGLAALSYTVAGFAAGYFRREEDDKYLYKYQFLMVVFVCCFISNFIYFIIYLQGTGVGFADIFISYILTSSTYTTLISVIYVIIPKKGELKKVY